MADTDARARAEQPDSRSAAETTGLKCAPETGPNNRISTASPNTVAVSLQELQSDVVGELLCGNTGPDHHGDQQGGFGGTGEVAVEAANQGRGLPARASAPSRSDSCCSASGMTR